MPWNDFLHCQPLCGESVRWTTNSQWPAMQSFDISFVVSLNKLFNTVPGDLRRRGARVASPYLNLPGTYQTGAPKVERLYLSNSLVLCKTLFTVSELSILHHLTRGMLDSSVIGFVHWLDACNQVIIYHNGIGTSVSDINTLCPSDDIWRRHTGSKTHWKFLVRNVVCRMCDILSRSQCVLSEQSIFAYTKS